MALGKTFQSTRLAQWMTISIKGNCFAQRAPSPGQRGLPRCALTPCVLVWFSLGAKATHQVINLQGIHTSGAHSFEHLCCAPLPLRCSYILSEPATVFKPQEANQRKPPRM